jgi:hypothetical protein
MDLGGGPCNVVVLKFYHAPKDLIKQIAKPLGSPNSNWDLGIFISNKFPGDAIATYLGTMLSVLLFYFV